MSSSYASVKNSGLLIVVLVALIMISGTVGFTSSRLRCVSRISSPSKLLSTVSTECASQAKDSSSSTSSSFIHRSNLQQQVKPKVLFFLGGPGAGKGTQCEKLSSEFGMKHLSAGELLREERMSGSANGQLIESYLKEGKIVPVKITLDLLRQRMEQEKDTNRFLVDGFPRNWDNVQGWDSCMNDVCDVEAVIFLDCPETELEKRLVSRGKTSGRSDDNLETARKRFATFKEATLPVVQHYEGMNKLIKIGGDQPVEEVFRGLRRAVVPYIEKEIRQLTQIFLDAVTEGDWDTYNKLCDPSLTSFEAESKGNLVEGLDFHKFYFDLAAANSAAAGSSVGRRTVIKDANVIVMGKSAVISYVRAPQDGSSADVGVEVAETRVWQLADGGWRLVHFHRGPVPSINNVDELSAFMNK